MRKLKIVTFVVVILFTKISSLSADELMPEFDLEDLILLPPSGSAYIYIDDFEPRYPGMTTPPGVPGRKGGTVGGNLGNLDGDRPLRMTTPQRR